MLSTTLLHLRGASLPTPAQPYPLTHLSHGWCPGCHACRRHCTCGHSPDMGVGSGEEPDADGPAGVWTAKRSWTVTLESRPFVSCAVPVTVCQRKVLLCYFVDVCGR